MGQACEEFSNIYRNHRGLFIAYPDRDHLDDILRSATKDNVKVIVITDGERILGLGDQGIGGMSIPIGKLSLYTACGGISPANTLPIMLDVGTNNEQLLADPRYMGWRNERISGAEYNNFVEAVMQAIQRRWPNVVVQFEDFAQTNAMPILERYRDQFCCFNDDIQGTASVCVATLMAACQAKQEPLRDQRVVFMGAGSAGCGIAEQVIAAMVAEGLSEAEARAQIFMIDRPGLLTQELPDLFDFQQRLAQPEAFTAGWPDRGLLSVVQQVKPTILIGVSGQTGLFTEAVIKAVHAHCQRPVIMPLSNPTSRVEATPEQVLTWTQGQALVATGSPFAPVRLNGQTYPIAQCNNAYIFPGIGLGVVAVGATRVTDVMLMAASEALAAESPMLKTGQGALLPAISDIQAVSRAIAFAVARQAQVDGVALQSDDATVRAAIDQLFWSPQYRTYRRRAS